MRPSRSTSTPWAARRRTSLGILLGGSILALLFLFPRCGEQGLVVYCAHDALYAEQILADFERKTGIAVELRFDTEATKSLGLVEQIIRERKYPRCDVFWNNEQLGTMRLQEEGLLVAYKGSGYDRIPAPYKDPDGHWVGFAARLRVWIVNTEGMQASASAVQQALAGDLSRVAMAKPLYGTTRTHYTVLFDSWGKDRLQNWHHSVRKRGMNEVGGNAMVKNLVAAGTCDLGLTDTDDFFVAKDAGHSVAMLPFVLENGQHISIPNTVAIIVGPRSRESQEKARKLVDFLLSKRTEVALARSRSRQIPLGPIPADDIPQDVTELMHLAKSSYPLANLGGAARDCLEWLRSEYDL